jgi:23S rRNA (adenine2503-C2)-methyltransferase
MGFYMKWIYDLSFDELADDIFQLRLTRYAVDQIFSWLYRKINPDIDFWTNIAKKNREILKKMYDTRLDKIMAVRTDDQGTKKFLLRLRDGQAIESVLMKEKEHYTCCLSSQVGCSLNCAFCATGKMGFIRDLSSGEILTQLLLMKKYLGNYRGKLNIVFMGMGEPLLNYENLSKALGIITSETGMGISPRNITLSTAGILEKIKQFDRDFPRIKFSFSLNAPDDETRKKLMPVSRRENLDKILEYFRKARRKYRMTVEYVLIRGLNDSRENALSVARLLKGIPCKINIIPYNSVETCKFNSPDENIVNEFADILYSKGYTVLVRWSKGRDIKSACGQLAAKRPAGKNK